MAGAHLDSVLAGPGINDNGSGSAALLEVAQNLANHRPRNTLRFAWWGAEEARARRFDGVGRPAGRSGNARRDRALPELRHDRLAELLHRRLRRRSVVVRRAAGRGADIIPDGSAAIEDVFESFYTLVGEPYDDTEFSGRSDYQAFINNGIPASGLFTGAEVQKTAEQAAIWGGTVGAQFDPCYHAGVRHVRQRRRARARRQHRRHRLRRADVRLLDRVGERRPRPARAGQPAAAGARRPRGHVPRPTRHRPASWKGPDADAPTGTMSGQRLVRR